MSSDQVIWSEQGRLHLSYTGTISDVTGHGGTNSAPSQITLSNDIDGNTVANDGHGVRVNDLLLVATASGTARCIVHAVDAGATTIEVSAFGLADLASLGADGVACTVMVFGSEFAKGTTGRSVANSPAFQTFTNKPIILKDYYEISGSDASQIGWVEVTGEDGQNGYYWYLKAQGETR